MPCANGIRRRPVCVSMWPMFALIPTSTSPEPMPAAVSPRISPGSVVASPGSVVPIAKTPQPIATARAPKRRTAGAASRNIEGIDPTETKSIAMPSAPFVVFVASCTSGSTAAHAPQKRPSARKPASVGLRRGIPALRQLRRRPLGRRQPVLPAGRPGPLVPDALALRADRDGFVLRHPPDPQRRLQLVLVLPFRLAGERGHPDVEHVVARGDRALAEDVCVLEVDVPADERVVGVAHDPQRVRAGTREELDQLRAVPRPQHRRARVSPALVERHVAQPAPVFEHRDRDGASLRHERHEQLRRVLDDAHRTARVVAAVDRAEAKGDDVAVRPLASAHRGGARTRTWPSVRQRVSASLPAENSLPRSVATRRPRRSTSESATTNLACSGPSVPTIVPSARKWTGVLATPLIGFSAPMW